MIKKVINDSVIERVVAMIMFFEISNSSLTTTNSNETYMTTHFGAIIKQSVYDNQIIHIVHKLYEILICLCTK